MVATFCLAANAQTRPNPRNENSHATDPQAQAGPKPPVVKPPPPPCGLNGHPSNAQPECREAGAAEKTADYTLALVVVGALQVLALIGQIIALLLTVRQSRVATGAAVESVGAAQRSATAAEKAIQGSDQALAHAKSVSEQELRAYVGIVSATASIGQFRGLPAIEIKLRIKNAGKTPARKLSVSTGYGYFENAEKIGRPKLESLAQDTIILPGADVFYRFFMDRLPDASDETMKVIVVYGRIGYEDVFKGTRHTNFRMTLGGNVLEGRTTFHPTRTGNDAT
ncbi:MAG TPA: hypothetical protein VGL66_07530 [Caulobacteraceae bacterium]